MRAIFDDVVDLPHEEREGALKVHCAGDMVLLDEVRALLAVSDESNLALDRSPVAGLGISGMLPGRLEPGRVLAGRFEIIRQLGEGGIGEVYEAQDSVLGQRVALKTLHSLLAQDPAVVERFKQEILLARRLTHPNVCRTFDFYQAEAPFLTMELLEGETLAARIRREGAMPEADALPILRQVLDGLAAAHAQDVLHRDLKPSNIFLCSGRAVVLDFGLARLQGTAGDDSAGPNSALGTPAYMSPEQLENRPLTKSSDIYSIGVVLYEMLTGAAPHAGLSPLAIAARRVQEPPPSPRAANPSVPERVDALTRECMAVKPDQRPRDAAALLAKMGGQSPRWRVPRMNKRWITSAAAIVALASVIGFALRSRGPSEAALRFHREGLIAWRDGSAHRAAHLFGEAIKADPDFALSHARLAQSLLEIDAQDRAKDAMLSGSQAARKPWFTPARESLEFEALSHWLSRDFSKSSEAFEKLAASAPEGERGAALIDLALARIRAEQTPAARSALDQAAAADPRNPAVHLQLGILQARAGSFDAARGSFDKAEEGYRSLAQVEGAVRVNLERGEMFRRASKFSESRQALETAARQAGSAQLGMPRLQAEFGLVVTEVAAGNRASAEARLRSAVEMARDKRLDAVAAVALNDLGFAHLTQYRLAEAERVVRQALEIAREQRARQTEARAHLLLGSIHYHATRFDEAAAHATRALHFYSVGGYRRNHSQALLLSARIETASGRLDSAQKQWRQLRETLDPKSYDGAIAAEGFATVLSHQGEFPAALELYRSAEAVYRAASRASSLAYCLMNQADLLWRLGDPAAARKLYADAVSASKNDPRTSARAALAEAFLLVAYGDRAGAAERLRDHRRHAREESPFVTSQAALLEASLGNSSRMPSACELALEAIRSSGAPRTLEILLQCSAAVRRPGWTSRARALAVETENSEGAYRAALLGGDQQSAESSLALLRKKWGEEVVGRYLRRPDIEQLRK